MAIIAIICLIIDTLLVFILALRRVTRRQPPIDNDRLRHMTQREIDKLRR